MVGQGKIEFCHGRVDSGWFDKNMLNGEGKSLYADGDVYTGQFKAGKRDGHGRYQYPSGSYYIGDFKANFQNGHGRFFNAQTGSSYVGGYKNGLFNGLGHIFKQNGDVLTAQFTPHFSSNYEEEYISAEGRYVWFNGDVYEGSFALGLMEDVEATFTEKSSGAIFTGKWKEGLPVGIHKRLANDGSEDQVLAVPTGETTWTWEKL